MRILKKLFLKRLEEELQALFREQRQAGIKSELMDTISGFDALSDEEFSM